MSTILARSPSLVTPSSEAARVAEITRLPRDRFRESISNLTANGSDFDLGVVAAVAAVSKLSIEQRYEAVDALKAVKTAQGRAAVENIVQRLKEDVSTQASTAQRVGFSATCKLLARCGTSSACELLRNYASFRGDPNITEAVTAGHTLALMGTAESDRELRTLLTKPVQYLNGVCGAARGLSERYDTDPTAQVLVRDLIFGGKGSLSAQREIVNFICAQTQTLAFWAGPLRPNLSDTSLSLIKELLLTGASTEVTKAAAQGLASNISRGGRAYSLATECVCSNKVSVPARITILISLWESRAQNPTEVIRLAKAFASSSTAPKELRDCAASLLCS